MTSDQSDDGGPVAQEAKRLAEAVSAWAASSHRSQTSGDEDEAGGEQQDSRRPGCSCGESSAVDSVCSVCPVCRVAAAVQAIQPEVIERVADVLTMFAGSLQQVADDRRRQREDTAQKSDRSSTEDDARGSETPDREDETP